MYPSVAIFALANFIPPSPAPAAPHWFQDYWTAQKRGQSEKKPLAVFVGSGQNGFSKLSGDGNLTEPVQKILAEKYVCVYLDTTKKIGMNLADDLQITKGLGLVISDRSGRIQAYHHDGGFSAHRLPAKMQKIFY